jgi:hypothetical protein
MEHLHRIVDRLGLEQRPVNPRDTFYYRERQLCLDILSGRRPQLTTLPGLLSKLALEPFSTKEKFAMALFFFLSTVLPDKRAKTMLAYRLKAGHRSALGLAKAIFGPGTA